ncbi:MAG: hypothetical protein ACXVLQ_13320 [Bacteriovorax sp.]
MKMIKDILTFKWPAIALVPLVLSSCVPDTGSNLRSRDSSGLGSGSANVSLYQGRILADNPIIVSKNADLATSYDLNRLLSTATITTNSFLNGNASCYGLEYCFEVRETKESVSALQTTNGKWAFNATTPEFLQVNTFYHLNKVTDMFYTNMSKGYSLAYDAFSFPQYDTSLPLNLISSPGVYKVINNPLIAYANCDVANNAYFDRANQTLCFGYNSDSTIKWAQDSTVIYHETGHFFQKLQLNMRNSLAGARADMGNIYYDEAGSIGEGLSDYYSFFVNGRTHFSEWAAGKLQASRPMTESDPIHTAGISDDPDQRLSYPQFLNYDPNFPTVPVEDIHYSGMIISHYLVALTTDLQNKCAMTKRDATDMVMHLITETMAEHGDLSSNGTQGVSSQNKINLRPSLSLDWFSKVNPINYRSFMQTFAKNILNNLGNAGLARCNGSVYTKDMIESLMDQYGLLLFRTYNEHRNLSNPGTVNNTAVNATNRKKSVLISKNLLVLDPTTNASSAYVIDNRAQIQAGITSLQSVGLIGSLSSQTPSDLGFNNNNGKVSPGEVVAIALNLYNNSNSTMGGVQILANDWNHADASGKPCQFGTSMSNDQWPLVSEGGVPCSTVSASVATDFAPICFMQSNESNSTKWVSQTEFKTKMALDSSFCLDPSNTKDCFIRAIKGADQAHYSKLNPKSTWAQTLTNPDPKAKAPALDWGNVFLLEVSKHIPPGTVVDCRLRLRFTNCDDCYHDSTRSNYDYTDTDYNGPRPYKIIHLQIPIVD